MSVSIHWRPISDVGKSFKGGTSSSLEVLTAVFGSGIGSADGPKLRAMAVATKDDFYNEVADIVEQVGAIEIWGEY